MPIPIHKLCSLNPSAKENKYLQLKSFCKSAKKILLLYFNQLLLDETLTCPQKTQTKVISDSYSPAQPQLVLLSS